MLHLIPPPLHRAGLRLAHAIRRRWWRFAKTKLNGCRVLGFDDRGQLLLIRHSYGSGNWMLPGGGLGRDEDALAGALRELHEECGCTLLGARLFQVTEEPLYGTINRVHLVTGTIAGTPRGDGREVIELAFFRLDALPPNLSPMIAARLGGWLSALER